MTDLGFPLRRWAARHRAEIGVFAAAFALAQAAGCAASSTTGTGGGGSAATTSSDAGTGGAGGATTSSTTSATTSTTSTTSSTTSTTTSTTSTTSSSTASTTSGTGGGGFMPPMGTADFPAEAEQNNLKSTANALAAGTKGFTASIWPVGDIDVFAFDVTVPGSNVSVKTSDGMGGCPAGAKTYVRVFDASNNVLATDNGTSGCVSLTPASSAALGGMGVGTYYVHVESFNGSAIPYYRLDIDLKAPGCGDGLVQVIAGEQCDDGNAAGGDGCSATCKLESGSFLNETEPNDTQAMGNDISGYAGAIGQINPAGDVDWYTFDVTVAGSSVTAETTNGFGGCPTNFDSKIYLYSPSATVLASDDQGGVSPCSKISPAQYPAATNLPVGKYAIKVERFGGTQTAPYYALKLKVSPPGCGDGIITSGEQCDDGNTTSGDGCSATCQFEKSYIPETEVNDTQALANPLGTADGFIASIKPASDVDFFSFDVAQAGSLVIIQTSDGVNGCPTGFDSKLTLFDPNGMVVVTDDDGAGVGKCSKISPLLYPQAANLMPGNYKVKVEIPGGASTAQQYVVSIVAKLPGCGDGIIQTGEQCDDGNKVSGDGCSDTCQSEAPWEIEPNNATTTATPLWPMTSTWKGAISPKGDHDYYVFTLASAGTVTLVTHDLDQPTVCSFDTVIHLLDSNGTQITYDDDGGPGPGDTAATGKCSKISKMLSAGTYYVWVQRYNDVKVIPAYQLDYSVQ